MTYYVGLPLVIFAALLEASVLPLFQIGGLQPNLVLVLLIAWLTVRGESEAFVLIPAGGLMLGLTDGAPFGTAMIALAPMVLLHELHGSHLREGSFVLSIAFTVIMTVVFNAVYLIAFAAAGQSGDGLNALTRVAVPACLLNVAALMPGYLLLSIVSQDARRPGYA